MISILVCGGRSRPCTQVNEPACVPEPENETRRVTPQARSAGLHQRRNEFSRRPLKPRQLPRPVPVAPTGHGQNTSVTGTTRDTVPVGDARSLPLAIRTTVSDNGPGGGTVTMLPSDDVTSAPDSAAEISWV